MKYCTKCGAKMNDDALFCPKCGAQVDEIKNQFKEDDPEQQPEQQEVVEQEVVEEASKEEINTKKKANPKALHEQTVKEFLPAPLVLIACSIALWIINVVGHPTGITQFMPLLLFIMISVFLAVMSMIRAVKSLNRKMFFKAALSFTLFALLVVCTIIDLTFLF